MHSTDNDCAASQDNTITQTTAQTRTLMCSRARCPVVFVYDVATDWPTVSCLVNDHSVVCKDRFYRPANSPPQFDTHGAQHALCPPRLIPASGGIHGGNRDEVIADGSRERKNEDERKRGLDNDEYAEDVQPKFIKCRGCHKTIKLDNRYRYYPGLWLNHRKICKGILKIKADNKLARKRERGFQLNPKGHSPAASSLDASGEKSDEFEYQPRHIMGFSTSYVRGGWEGVER
ncbi:hypothetical protein CY34DRAFT_8836 [Suillus luteus UH-Slu-Lm8-n1]|uniref:Uncharacterized protein n=1 Tax=Suillus luteus UH-Slu-Lm8-n1 TaxID=930992 RepID=A0A0D0BCV6_9AGAM|nr:hypothetical protein CY34DRAFT_8836 [Suillus luteus UH-Slu-Lm8-n1]